MRRSLRAVEGFGGGRGGPSGTPKISEPTVSEHVGWVDE